MQKLEINTERLRIRNLRESDLSDFLTYRSNPEITKYQSFDVMTIEEARDFIKRHQDKLFGQPGEWVQYAVEVVSGQQLVGDCAIKLDLDDPRIAEVGITISHLSQQKGYAKEVLTAILDFLFSIPDFHRVVETVDVENVASIALLDSIGFQREGHSVENIFFNGKWGSEYQYAMLRQEWLDKKLTKRSGTMDRFKETADAYNRLAGDYEKKFMDLNLYDDSYDALCQLLPNKAHLLEIASGPGNITRYLIAKRPDITIDATDVAPNMVALAQKNNPTANCFVLDCRNLNSIQKNYDAIVCGFCLPYLPPDSCKNLVSDSSRLLNPNGILYLSMIEGTEKDSGYIWNSAKTDRIYMYYHSTEFITQLFESNGFTIVDQYRKAYTSGSQESFHLIFIAQKKA